MKTTIPDGSAASFQQPYEKVCNLLKTHERPNISLIKGWFSESFKRPEIQGIDKICYARIDSDLYQPAVECLDFLRDRLVDGAILVFDDWSWGLEKGESKALSEWLPTSGLELEFLAYNGIVHLYLRVHKKIILSCSVAGFLGLFKASCSA